MSFSTCHYRVVVLCFNSCIFDTHPSCMGCWYQFHGLWPMRTCQKPEVMTQYLTSMCIPVAVQAAVYWQDFCAFFSQMERSLSGHPVLLPFYFCLILCMIVIENYRKRMKTNRLYVYIYIYMYFRSSSIAYSSIWY